MATLESKEALICSCADGTAPIKYSNRASEYRLNDSRLESSVAEDISSVVVLVDAHAAGQATVGQLADYVAMVGLARIDPEADLAGSSTILNLFAAVSGANRPAALTSWDQAFLRGLYRPYDPSLRQRALIATSMARDLVP